jgi:putative protease
MRIVATLTDIREIPVLSALGADVFLVHPADLSCKARRTFSNPELLAIFEQAHQAGKRVYVHVNRIIHEPDLSALEDFLSFLAGTDVDGIVCFDLTVLAVAENYGLAGKIIYQPGTMNTNSYDPWFFRKLRIKGITLSKDITLSELISIGENYQGLEISVVGHGYLDLFYSKRPLLRNYFIHKNQKAPGYLGDESFRLVEKARPDDRYPIYEDAGGTHIFRSGKLQSFNEIKVIRPYLTDFFVDRMFLEDEEYFAALAAYADETKEAEFLRKFGFGYDSGFYYQKALLKKGGDRG